MASDKYWKEEKGEGVSFKTCLKTCLLETFEVTKNTIQVSSNCTKEVSSDKGLKNLRKWFPNKLAIDQIALQRNRKTTEEKRN